MPLIMDLREVHPHASAGYLQWVYESGTSPHNIQLGYLPWVYKRGVSPRHIACPFISGRDHKSHVALAIHRSEGYKRRHRESDCLFI